VTLFAKTDPDAGNKGISSFIVRPEEDDGFIVEGTEDKLGDKGCPTAELRFDDLWIPEDRLLGDEGDGFVQALKTLNGGRITIAARSIGIAQAALDEAAKYSQDREQFDQPISEFQAIQHKLADMDTKTRAARLLMRTTPLTRRSAARTSSRRPHRRNSTPAKSLVKSQMKGSRSTAATATPRTSLPSGSTVTLNSTRSTREPAKCCGTRSPNTC